MTDRYAVIGNPVEHSKSPQIHAEFAKQTGQDISYERLLAPLDAFAATVRQFFSEGGKGLNVTVPFKREAWDMIDAHAGDALDAEAVNTIKSEGGKLVGHNTDGIGLVTDIKKNLGFEIAGKRVLLLGTGGAAYGVMFPLLRESRTLTLAYRTLEKAQRLVKTVENHQGVTVAGLEAKPYDGLAGEQFDIVINATSAGLSGEMPPLPPGIFAPGALAYDMVYGRDTPFLAFARKEGATRAVDGLGMLVEQAAESFYIWRGVRPRTAPVIALLRGTG